MAQQEPTEFFVCCNIDPVVIVLGTEGPSGIDVIWFKFFLMMLSDPEQFTSDFNVLTPSIICCEPTPSTIKIQHSGTLPMPF